MTAALVTQTDWHAALDAVAHGLLDEAGCQEPPVNAVALAHALGIDVVLDRGQSTRGRCVRLLGDRRTILVRPEERLERMQWSVAHELGEFLARRVFERLDVDADQFVPEEREQAADGLASRILIPPRWFEADARRLRGDLLALKRIYSTASHESLAWRLLDLSEPTVVTVLDQGKLTRRRANFGKQPPTVQRIEFDLWKFVHARNEAGSASSRGVHVQAWPVHEPGWKRELLRTTLDWDAG